ncbi:6-phosphogluconate dehydrogenase, decarboxylating [subsurface metagenome]
MLEPIRVALKKNPSLPNLMMDETFGKQLNGFHPSWRRVVTTAVQHGIPRLAMSASLGYFDMYRKRRLPANLTQAQRDFFGAHTYNRIDKEGDFHTIWSEE